MALTRRKRYCLGAVIAGNSFPAKSQTKFDPSRLFHGEAYELRRPAHLGRAGKILRQDYIVWTVFNVVWKK